MAYVVDTQSRISHWLAHQAKRDPEFRVLLQSIASGDTVRPLQSKQLRRFQIYLKEHRHLAGLDIVDLENVNPSWSMVGCDTSNDWTHENHQQVAHRALALLAAQQGSKNAKYPFPYLDLPPELRLKVYKLAFQGRENPTHPKRRNYLNPLQDINVALLRTCRRIYDEAEPILYQDHKFDFRTRESDVLEFLKSLSERARRNMKYIGLDLWYFFHPIEVNTWLKEDLRNWGEICSYIADHLSLREMRFDICVEAVPADFKDTVSARWIQNMIRIRGIERLTQGIEETSAASLQKDMLVSGLPTRKLNDALRRRLSTLLEYLKSEMITGYLAGSQAEVWNTDGCDPPPPEGHIRI